MQAVGYHLLLSFARLVPWMPFRVLYWTSDVCSVLAFHVVRYRRQVVAENLRRSFPEKSQHELDVLARAFYTYFCDFWLEAFKLLGMSEQQVQERCPIKNVELFERLFEQQKSIIVVLGHYGNWEWCAASSCQISYPLQLVYKPLSNTHFDTLARRIRSRFGIRLMPLDVAYREMAKRRQTPTATAFVADQAPSPEHAYWTEFLHQDTPVSSGVEKIARRLNRPVVFLSTNRLRRGFYEAVAEVLTDDPRATAEGFITELYTRRLEQQILEQPATWLWSHRRWKHTRRRDTPSASR